MKYLLYIFDVDGTLIDSSEANRACYGKVFTELGMPPAYVHRAISLTGMEVSEIFEALGVGNPQAVADFYRQSYSEFEALEKPYPGIPSLLKKLKKQVLLAAATNRDKWDTSNLLSYFDLLIGSEGIAQKPDIEMFRKIIDFFAAQGKELEPKDCLMIGDSPLDIEFARNCGMDSAYVSWGFFQEDELVLKPDYVIHSAKELSELNEMLVEIEITDELDLHQFQDAETERLLKDYLASAHEKGYHTVRIVHGKGKGTIREIVRSVLESHRLVNSYEDAPEYLGGLGATIAYLIDK